MTQTNPSLSPEVSAAIARAQTETTEYHAARNRRGGSDGPCHSQTLFIDELADLLLRVERERIRLATIPSEFLHDGKKAGELDTRPEAGVPDHAVIAGVRAALWEYLDGRAFGEDRSLVGMVKRLGAQRDEARTNRKGEFDLRMLAEARVTALEQQVQQLTGYIQHQYGCASLPCFGHSDGTCCTVECPQGGAPCDCGLDSALRLASSCPGDDK